MRYRTAQDRRRVRRPVLLDNDHRSHCHHHHRHHRIAQPLMEDSIATAGWLTCIGASITRVTITIIASFRPGTDETITTPGRFTAPRTAVGIVEVAIVAGLNHGEDNHRRSEQSGSYLHNRRQLLSSPSSHSFCSP